MGKPECPGRMGTELTFLISEPQTELKKSALSSHQNTNLRISPVNSSFSRFMIYFRFSSASCYSVCSIMIHFPLLLEPCRSITPRFCKSAIRRLTVMMETCIFSFSSACVINRFSWIRFRTLISFSN